MGEGMSAGLGGLLERGLARDRLIVGAGLAVLTLLAWLYILDGAGTGMSVMAMTTFAFPPPVRPSMAMVWSPAYWAIMFLMWWVMMIAMMTPSAAPMVLLHARVTRHAQKKGRMAAAPVPTAWFYLGYLAAWGGFSLLATGLQWGLERLGLMHAMLMWSSDLALSAGLLIAAGLYQLSPFKHRCLEHCRSPVEYLSRHFRPGSAGAFRMGLTHGAYCLGCCWGLMALLFVGGTMNLVWIALLAILVLGEKLLPYGGWLARALGIAMVAAGLWIALGGSLQ